MPDLALLDALARGLAVPTAGAILVNQLDDLFLDASYFARGLHRRAGRALPARVLANVTQRRIAIMVPAWMEADVIGHMLAHNRAELDFDRTRYDIFCGTYANDPETQANVDAVARRDPGVRKVVVPHDGPTSKADCLNWIYQGVVEEERRRGVRYDVLLMHDAEDVIHPLALRLYCLLLPAHDFVQTPVFSLELGAASAVGGTYIDEFSEHHLKDMRVRAAMGGLVPSAGVGSAFAREAFAEIAARHGQRPFDVTSLTEDYEIGLKFRLAGKKVSFACHTVVREVTEERGLLRRRAVRVRREEFIATREYFPDALTASVRQRARWILGITLQAWQNIGWQGPPAVRYCLWRDRKGLLNTGLLAIAYLLVAYVLARTALGALAAPGRGAAPLAAPGSALAAVLAVNLAGMLWRAGMKVWFVGRLYGVAQGLLSIPRLLLANVIGMAATARAVRIWVGHRRTGTPLRWFKTAHVYPSTEALAARRRRLGELLVEGEALAAVDLEAALALQREVPLPLGELLAVTGALPHDRVLRGLAAHFELETCTPDAARIPRELLRRVPEADAEALGVLPLDGGDGTAAVAVTRPLSPRERVRLEERLGARVEPRLAEARRVGRSRTVAYRRVHPLAPRRPMLGERLLARAGREPSVLAAALDLQLETGEQLGELLLRTGAASRGELEELFAAEGGFVVVAPGEADPAAVARLGARFCALHALAPLRRRGGARVVAAGQPVHPAVAAAATRRLGEEVRLVAAGSLAVRIALGVARAAGGRVATGRAPEPGGELLGLAGPGGGPDASTSAAGALPPALAAELGVAVLHVAPGALLLGASAPSVSLARRVAQHMPGWRIAWEERPDRGPASLRGDL